MPSPLSLEVDFIAIERNVAGLVDNSEYQSFTADMRLEQPEHVWLNVYN